MTAAAPDAPEPSRPSPPPEPAPEAGLPPADGDRPADPGALTAAPVPPPHPSHGFAPTAPTAPKVRRSPARDWSAAGIVVAALALFGVPLGLIWQAVAPRVPIRAVEGGFRYTQESPEGFAGDDGIFVLMGLGAGIAAALAVWFVCRHRRGPVLSTALVLGGIACQTVAWRFGRAVARGDWWWTDVDAFERAFHAARPGWTLFLPPDLLTVNFHPGEAWSSLTHGDVLGFFNGLQPGALATMSLAAVFVYTVLAGWSRHQTLHADTEPTAPRMQTGAPGDRTAADRRLRS